MENFNNSPERSKELKTEHVTDRVSTVKINRKYISKIVQETKLKKGEIIVRHSGLFTV